jgi:hypothetical protein
VGHRTLLLLGINLLVLVAGVGLLPVVAGVRTRAGLVRRLGLAYLLGLAAVGIAAALLALVGVRLGPLTLGLLAGACLVSGGLLLRHEDERSSFDEAMPYRSRAQLVALIGGGVLIAAAVLVLLDAARAFAVHPLTEFDGWAIWGFKAHALLASPDAAGPAFTSSAYNATHLDYPPLFPSLEALGFRAMGTYDPTLVHLQLALFGLGFATAIPTLLAGRTPLLLAGVAVLVLIAAPQTLPQLGSNYADVPLALFVAAGVAGLARWLLDEHATWALGSATVFFAAGALTKNEGALFALAALVAAAVGLLADGRRDRVPYVLPAALGVAAALIPWRLFVAEHGLHSNDFDLSRLLDPGYLAAHAGRAGPAAHALLNEVSGRGWGYALLLVALGLAAGLAVRARALVAFTATWLALSFGGLVVVYWVSHTDLTWQLQTSADRVVASLVAGGIVLAATLAGEAYVAAFSLGRDDRDSGHTA